LFTGHEELNRDRTVTVEVEWRSHATA